MTVRPIKDRAPSPFADPGEKARMTPGLTAVVYSDWQAMPHQPGFGPHFYRVAEVDVSASDHGQMPHAATPPLDEERWCREAERLLGGCRKAPSPRPEATGEPPPLPPLFDNTA